MSDARRRLHVRRQANQIKLTNWLLNLPRNFSSQPLDKENTQQRRQTMFMTITKNGLCGDRSVNLDHCKVIKLEGDKLVLQLTDGEEVILATGPQDKLFQMFQTMTDQIAKFHFAFD